MTVRPHLDPASLPVTGLPVEAVVPEVLAALADEAVGRAVLVAEPGAGKTTVVPLHLAAQAWAAGGRVVVLEPRRLAARAAARRLAELLGEPVGETVAYRTRDERVGGPGARLEVVTEGILVRRLQQDPTLPGVAAVVLDEVHERNLVTDLSLALTLDVRAGLRPDLRVLAMSATLDAERLAALLGGGDGAVPVVRSRGRSHPVTVDHDPPGPRDRPAGHLARAVAGAVARHPEGDVLAFLPGVAEIAAAQAALAEPGRLPPNVDVLPLHGSLPVADQDRALAESPPGRRRVVLSTDVAESSLTVPGVRIVVDAGLARVPRFDPGTGLTRLVTEPAARASLDQRAGRAGRLGPGAAVRLLAAEDELRRPPHPTPEIAQVDLAPLALELATWGAPPEALALLDPPPPAAWAVANDVVATLGAIDGRGRPTELGRRLAELPVHPRLGRAVLHAVDLGEGWTGSVVAALLDERDVLGGPPHERPVDLVVRAELVGGRVDDADHAAAVAGAPVDRGAVRTVRRRAEQLARRVGARPGALASDLVAELVAVAHPERVAQRRGAGFRLRDGGGVVLPATDPLAAAPWLAVAEVHVGRDGPTARLAAALDESTVERLVARAVEEVDELAWDDDRGDLRRRVERRAGALVLGHRRARPEPGPAVTAALVDRVRAVGLDALPWSPASTALRHRIAFLHAHQPDRWPDGSDAALLAGLDDWLAPLLAGADGWAAIQRLDLAAALTVGLDRHARRALDQLAPTSFVAPAGRTIAIDYGTGRPVARARVQDLFGTAVHPTVLGGAAPVTVELLSPANRPIQVTADLPGFWAGSWADVRKDLAGRYPKHAWPVTPTVADAPGPGRPRRQ